MDTTKISLHIIPIAVKIPFLTPYCNELRRSVINTGPRRTAVPNPSNKPCNKLIFVKRVMCWKGICGQRKTYQTE